MYEGSQWASSVESQAKTTGEVKRRRLGKLTDVVTRGRVEGLVFSSGLLQV